MEKFIDEIRAYAAAHGLHPSTVIQRAGCGGGQVWAKWLEGSSCSMRTADKLRAYMADNPAHSQTKEGAA